MLVITKRIYVADKVDDSVELPFLLRQKSRLRVSTKKGLDAGLFLERGQILRDGDLLASECGRVIQVVAAQEPVMDVQANSTRELTCAAYHLGNRHVPLQVGDSWLRLEQDHVLKEMLIGLGTVVTELYAPFEPEAGAYGGGHRHGHDDDKILNLRPMSQRQHG